LKISIIGTGYVGLVTGTCLAEKGNSVTCVDIDSDKINKLCSGKITIYEPGLESFFIKNLKSKNLRFSTNLKESIKNAEIIFLALPTPKGKDGSADLSYVLDVALQISKFLNSYKIIVNKSTVPVGTAEKVRNQISKNYNGNFDIVSNPEFLKEGVAVNDFMNPERIIIGSSSDHAKKIMSDLYKPFVKNKDDIIFMDERSSELTKYASNSFLATKISFMNEIAQLCELIGADVDNVRLGMGSDSRIGNKFLYPGIGYGGSCFPKDVKALIKSSSDCNYDFKILKSVENINSIQKVFLFKKLKKYFNNKLKGKKITIWGLAFKPNTDDIREAPSLSLISELIKENVKIKVYDPVAIDNVKNEIGNKIKYYQNKYDAANDADALIIATEWEEFKSIDYKKLKKLMNKKIIFDGRNILNSDDLNKHEFIYKGIGKGL
jgi:UDPglucose 6-dehydrogenase